MDKILAVNLFQNIVKNKENAYHKDYTYVCEYAKECETLITGKGLEEALKLLLGNSESAAVKNAIKHTQHVTMSYAKALLDPERKTLRASGIQNVLTGTNSDLVKILVEIGNEFFEGRDVDSYISSMLVNFMDIDPNSFMVLTWEDFDSTSERAQPYPYIVDSDDAIDYKFSNGKLQYLVEKSEIHKITKDGKIELDRYVIHGPITTYVFEQIEPEFVNINGLEIFTFEDTDKRFILIEAVHNVDEILAKRIGFVPDMITDGRTCRTFIDPSFPWLKKTIKVNSELDLTFNLVAFQKEFLYAAQCQNPTCRSGICNIDNTPCKTCGGTGVWRPATSAQDVTTLPLPSNPLDIVPLSSLYATFSPDVSIIQEQRSYMKELFDNAMRSVYSGDAFTKKDLTQVATTAAINLQAIYDSLQPFSIKISSLYEWIYKRIADITELSDGLVVRKIFPKDYGFQSKEDRVLQIKSARDAGVDSHIIDAMEDELARVNYSDNPEEYRRYQVMRHHYPFSGMNEEQKRDAIASGMVTKIDIALAYNFGQIFDLINADIADAQPNEDIVNFWALPWKKQREIINLKVSELLAKIEGKPMGKLELATGEDVELTDTELVIDETQKAAQNNLKGTVGGVTGIIEIIKNVGIGVLSQDAAVAILINVYGFDEATAINMTKKVATKEELIVAAKNELV